MRRKLMPCLSLLNRLSLHWTWTSTLYRIARRMGKSRAQSLKQALFWK